MVGFRSTRTSRGDRSRMVVVIRPAHRRMMKPAAPVVLSLHLNTATDNGNQQPSNDSFGEPRSQPFVFHPFRFLRSSSTSLNFGGFSTRRSATTIPARKQPSPHATCVSVILPPSGAPTSQRLAIFAVSRATTPQARQASPQRSTRSRNYRLLPVLWPTTATQERTSWRLLPRGER